MKTSVFLAMICLGGCSQFQAKKNIELPFSAGLLEKIQKIDRAPASLKVTDIEGKSSRRVYFSALYHQYLSMGHHLDQESVINSCPQFHHDKVEVDASAVPTFSIYRHKNNEAGEKDFFPETVFNRNFSMVDHYQQMQSELETLCEEGLSDNFYKFDNLITHYAGKPSFHSRTDAMVAVLKIPVFANYYMLQMFQPTQFVTMHSEEKRVIELTNTHWFEKYVAEAHRVRNNFIKNKMVLRTEE